MSDYTVSIIYVLMLYIFYYIFKFRNVIMLNKIILFLNILNFVVLLLDAAYIGNQRMFDFLFAIQAFNCMLLIYSYFDKKNSYIYNVINNTQFFCMVISSTFFKLSTDEKKNFANKFNEFIVANNLKDKKGILIINNIKKTIKIDIILKNKEFKEHSDNKEEDNYKILNNGNFIMYTKLIPD